MTDEAALMLRLGLFGLPAAVIYWFLSYEALGSVALLMLGAGPLFIALILLRMQPGEPQGFGDVVRRVIGAPREVRLPHDPDLAEDDIMVIPSPTIWPFVMSLGFAIALTGIIFGVWLTLIGGILVAASMWGWIESVGREYRAR